ncbi:phage tail protein [Clostridium drakei]|uniref:Phage tail fibre protein N-terminal domain-containing protein n=1 Tax=Clostridium drakei TaxID=332101 RepID=A0A2U8DMY3_9CLOT|nr:phage tail protein [Clostridium drakei]AWI04070.1 hypothetical protein B9W14_06025 [Clostridium drakei]
MEEQFYSILTKVGKAKIANASALGTKVNFTTFVLGDGGGNYYNPIEDQTTLKNQVWSGSVNNLNIDKSNNNWIVAEVLIPADIGNFMIREAGILDDEGNLLVIGKYPETYKPIASNGSTKDLTIRMILEVSNTAAVTLKVDQGVMLAHKEDVEAVQKKVESLQKQVDDEKNAAVFTNIYTKFTAEEDNIGHIPIGHANFNPEQDILNVKFLNEILTKEVNYNINSDNLSIDLIDWVLEKDETIYFETIKKCTSMVNESDGSLLEENSVNESKLSKSLQSKINKEIKAEDIKGNDGVTLEKVKEDFTSHLADNTKHLPSGGTVWQIVQKQPTGWGLIDLPPSKDIDNGRYQSVWGLDDAVLNNCVLENGIAKLSYVEDMIKNETVSGGANIWASYYVSQTITSDGISFDAIGYVELYVNKHNSPIGTLTVSLYDPITNMTLATANVIGVTADAKFCRATFDTLIPVIKEHGIIIRVYDGVSNSATNSYSISFAATDTFVNGFSQYSNNGFVSNGELGKDLTFRLGVYHKATTGTAIKTVTPSDLKKWGNIKWTQTTPTNTSVRCDVWNSAGTTVLKSNVTSIADLSDIDITANPSIKIKWILNRNSVSDTSPTVSNASVTWEGKGYSGDGAWEKIGNVILATSIQQIDFTLISNDYNYLKIIYSAKGISNSYINIQFNDDSSSLYNYGEDTLTTGSSAITLNYGASYNYGMTFGEIFMNNIQTERKSILGRYNYSNVNQRKYFSGAWGNTLNKINKISLSTGSGKFAIGSTFTLWGCK